MPGDFDEKLWLYGNVSSVSRILPFKVFVTGPFSFTCEEVTVVSEVIAGVSVVKNGTSVQGFAHVPE